MPHPGELHGSACALKERVRATYSRAIQRQRTRWLFLPEQIEFDDLGGFLLWLFFLADRRVAIVGFYRDHRFHFQRRARQGDRALFRIIFRVEVLLSSTVEPLGMNRLGLKPN